MKNIYSLKNALILGTISLSAFVSAQVQLKELTDFGTTIYDINNDGKGVHGNGYYDFATNSSASTETGVGQTVEITNSDIILGLIADESGENFIPAIRNSGEWSALVMDEAYKYILHGISENGMYVVGQTEWDFETDTAWPFMYNVESQTLTVFDNPLYEYGAAYGVNNQGIAVGWVDDLPSGTVRMPSYFDAEGNITLISESYGEASNINDNNEIVGSLEGVPFYFKIDGAELTTYEIPADYLSASFADISDNGIAVGYAETFIEGQGGLRNPIIFHPNLGAQPIFLADLLNDHDIDTSTFDGIGNKISSNGKYIGGWVSGPAFLATGWAVYLDDAVMSVADLNNSDLTFYPNPTKDLVNISSKQQIQNVSVYNLAGQKVISNSNLTNNQINVSTLNSGVYVFRVTLQNGKTETFKVVKK